MGIKTFNFLRYGAFFSQFDFNYFFNILLSEMMFVGMFSLMFFQIYKQSSIRRQATKIWESRICIKHGLCLYSLSQSRTSVSILFPMTHFRMTEFLVAQFQGHRALSGFPRLIFKMPIPSARIWCMQIISVWVDLPKFVIAFLNIIES